MNTRSCKQKGRRLCKQVQEIMLSIHFGDLAPADIGLPPCSVPGEDIWLSPKARSLMPIVIECKNQEKAKPWEWIAQAKTHSQDGRCPVVVFSRNQEKEPYAIISFRDLLGLMKKS